MDITVKRKGMKKKGRGSEELKKNSSKKLLALSVMMAAVLVSSVLVSFVPTAAVDTISFTIDPEASGGCEVAAYDVEIEYTAGFTSLDMTIPAGFGAVPPGGGDLIAEVWLWDDESHEYYITLTAKGTDEIDLVCVCGDDEVDYTFGASYGPGDTINIVVSCCGADAHASLTLPTNTEDGILTMLSPKTLTKVVISIKEFVKNPTMCGGYEFDLAVNGATASATVQIVGGKPDLVITKKWVEGNKIWYTIKNVGCAAARKSRTRLFIDGEYKACDTVEGLPSGESSTEIFKSYKWTCTPPGREINVTVCADYKNKVEECDEENNCKTQIEVCPPNLPDLVIKKKWEEQTGEPGYYKVHFEVKNIGVATALKGHSAKLTVDEGEATESIQHMLIPRTLRSGKSYEGYFEEPVNCTGENDTIKVCADGYGGIGELNETNNCLENELSCIMKPDLVIYEKRERGAKKGNKYKVYFKIKNIGTATAPGDHWVKLTVDEGEATESIQDKHIRKDLEPGDLSRRYSFKRVVCTGGFDTIKVCADGYGGIGELNETNNCRENVWICGG